MLTDCYADLKPGMHQNRCFDLMVYVCIFDFVGVCILWCFYLHLNLYYSCSLCSCFSSPLDVLVVLILFCSV